MKLNQLTALLKQPQLLLKEPQYTLKQLNTTQAGPGTAYWLPYHLVWTFPGTYSDNTKKHQKLPERHQKFPERHQKNPAWY